MFLDCCCCREVDLPFLVRDNRADFLLRELSAPSWTNRLYFTDHSLCGRSAALHFLSSLLISWESLLHVFGCIGGCAEQKGLRMHLHARTLGPGGERVCRYSRCIARGKQVLWNYEYIPPSMKTNFLGVGLFPQKLDSHPNNWQHPSLILMEPVPCWKASNIWCIHKLGHQMFESILS